MNKNIIIGTLCLLAGCETAELAKQDSLIFKKHAELESPKGILLTINEDNKEFTSKHKKADFEVMLSGQQPRAVVIACCDSRFHSHAIDQHPDNDLFIIRNIGNQYKNAKGGVKYGVNHLGADVVLVVGHDDCGAVKAATSGYSVLEKDIRNELTSLHPKEKYNLLDKNDKIPETIVKKNVEENVHEQVKAIVNDPEVKDNKTHKKPNVFGAIYDFNNLYGQGYGTLVFVNFNGERDIAKINQQVQALNLDELALKIGEKKP